MNWLCPVNFWPDDCLSHGVMMWISLIIGGFTFIYWLKEKLIKRRKRIENEKVG